MAKIYNSEKGVILALALVVMLVLLILTGVYFSGLISEKRVADSEKFVVQALGLAEAGANQGQTELRARARSDTALKGRVSNVRMASVFAAYVTGNNSLGFLRDYAYSPGQPQFTVSGGKATVGVTALNLNTGVAGNYASTITVEANGNPTNPSSEVYVFPYKYYIDAAGNVTKTTPNTSKNTRLAQGTFTLTIRRDNFAKFALFTSHHSTPSGTTVWFTANTNFTGPVHTNERFSFANNPSAHITEETTQHQQKARFYNDGWPVLMDSDHNSNKDVPVFDKGFQRSYDIINLESTLTQTDLKNAALGGTSEPGSNGIFVPNNGTKVVGGIYIRGNQGQHSDDASITMTAGANGPVYTIVQSATTKVISVNFTANQTTVQTVGGSTSTYQGIPDGTGHEGILIYANDDVQSLSGTVQKDTQATVSGERDIVITNNIRYQQYNAGPPLNADGYNNVFGILSWGGNVRIGTGAPNDLQIHAVVMAEHGIFTVDNYDSGAQRGVATLLGGAITDFYGPFGTFSGDNPTHGYGRNFLYDDRMLNGMAPPSFPYMSNFTSFDDGGPNKGLDKKLVWQDKGV